MALVHCDVHGEYRKGCKRCREKMRAWSAKYYSTHPGYISARVISSHAKLKRLVLVHYSRTDPPQCANPFGIHTEPFTMIEALSIDHINGGGNKERKALFGKNLGGAGANFYRWLRDSGFPDGYQVLCMNDQWIKRARNKEARGNKNVQIGEIVRGVVRGQ